MVIADRQGHTFMKVKWPHNFKQIMSIHQRVSFDCSRFHIQEKARFQGIGTHEYLKYGMDKLSEKGLSDLAGNAYFGGQFISVLAPCKPSPHAKTKFGHFRVSMQRAYLKSFEK